MRELTYGDIIIIKGEKRKRKVLTEKDGIVYFGSFADKVKREHVEVISSFFNSNTTKSEDIKNN